MDPAAEVVDPAWRALDKELRQARSRAATLLRRIADARRRLPFLKRPKAAGRRLARIEAEEAALATRIEHLAARRAKTPRTIAAGDLPEDGRLDALPSAERAFVDLIRIFAYRAETRMAAAVGRPGRSGMPSARALLQHLFTSPADILPDHEAGILRVRIRGQATAAIERHLEPLLAELDETRTVYPGTRLRLVCETAATPRSD